MIAHLLEGCGLGIAAMLGLGYWYNRREELMIEAFIQEEEDKIIAMFELMLLGVEDEDITGFVVASPVEKGVVALKMILATEEADEIYFARADGFNVSLIGFQEWASIASYEVVKAIPCIEDFDSDDFWEGGDEDDEEFVD